MIFFQKPQVRDATISFRLPIDVLGKINSYCAGNDVTRSQLLRRLISDYPPIKESPAEPEPEPKTNGWFSGNKH